MLNNIELCGLAGGCDGEMATVQGPARVASLEEHFEKRLNLPSAHTNSASSPSEPTLNKPSVINAHRYENNLGSRGLAAKSRHGSGARSRNSCSTGCGAVVTAGDGPCTSIKQRRHLFHQDERLSSIGVYLRPLSCGGD